MDPFQHLPWFVLRRVLSDLPDLQSLYRIRLGSPAVAAFLRQDGGSFTTIVESIMSYNRDTSGLLPANQARIRNLVLWWWWVRSKNSHVEPNPGDNPIPQTSGEVIRFFFSNVHPGGRVQEHLDAIYGETPLPLSTPPIILFRLLVFSNRLRQIVHVCFHDLIACCMTLKPEHLEDPRFRYKNKATRLITDRSARPPSIPYLPVDIGPPTWLEEQIIMGSLLAVVLSMELRNSLCSRDDLGVGEEARRFVCDSPIIEFWNNATRSHHRGDREEQDKTVFSWLERRSGGVVSIRPWLTSSPIPTSFISCCPEHTVSKLPDPAGDGDAYLYRTVGHCSMRRCRGFSMSPLRCINESTFRPYGLAIWDAARLEAFGLLPEGKRPQTSNFQLYFAWSSILTEEQWEQLVHLQTVTPYGS